MRMRRSVPATALLLAIVAAGAIAGDQLSADERWRFLQGGEPPDRYVRFLLDHPGSIHVAEARAWLEARDNEPLGRLVAPDATCRAIVQERAQRLLANAPPPDLREQYALTLPPDHFLAASRYIEVPRGADPASTPVERRITINLVATRDGGCTVFERWGIGSGLGDACRCEPVEAGYQFRSRLADGVLTDVARMRAGSAACGAVLDAAIGTFLGEVVAAKRGRADRLRAHRDAGKTLYPSEQSELADIEYALPFLQAGLSTPHKEEEERARLATLTPEQRSGYCTGLPGRIEQARQRVAMAEPPLP
ncbi:MAG: hypothetical protein J0M21_01115 [Xanthomonadales bacterium]|nr:hypothetical protein [Xanthomonadales bacterium]